jgi:hypothetical protein
MRYLLVGPLAVLGLTLTAYPIGAVSLSDLISTDGVVSSGDKAFRAFACDGCFADGAFGLPSTAGIDITAAALDPATVALNVLFTSRTLVGQPEQGALAQHLEFTLAYAAIVMDASRLIDRVGLAEAVFTGDTGVARIDELIFDPSDASLLATLSVDPLGLNTEAALSRPVPAAVVVARVTLDAGGALTGFAGVTGLDQVFSQVPAREAVPEPVTLGILAIGAVIAGVAIRRPADHGERSVQPRVAAERY